MTGSELKNTHNDNKKQRIENKKLENLSVANTYKAHMANAETSD